MKTSRLTGEQIVGFLRQAEAGVAVKELCRASGSATRRSSCGAAELDSELARGPVRIAIAGAGKSNATRGKVQLTEPPNSPPHRPNGVATGLLGSVLDAIRNKAGRRLSGCEFESLYDSSGSAAPVRGTRDRSLAGDRYAGRDAHSQNSMDEGPVPARAADRRAGRSAAGLGRRRHSPAKSERLQSVLSGRWEAPINAW